jgi:ABC-type bacteriocin/lantibiotic exporter with double-glycine peptidase domain
LKYEILSKKIISEIMRSAICDYIISGPSGSGKTTVLRSLKNTGPEEYLLFTNKFQIFSGSLFENITLGRECSVDISYYLKLLFPDAERLTRTETSISNDSLSSGQIQRICLLRDLIGARGLRVIFDEPTSNLDGRSERLVLQNLRNWKKDFGYEQVVVASHCPKEVCEELGYTRIDLNAYT